MRFSIVVPVYNAQKHLEPCVMSVACQTCKDFELILVDDGSKDDSGNMMDAFAARYSFIKVLHKENGGQFSARLAGIKSACGDYVIFLDSDDCLREDALETVNRYINDNDLPDIVFHNASIKEDYSECIVNYPFADGTVFEKASKAQLYELFVTSSALNSMCFKAYSRTLLEGVEWDCSLIASIRNGEDLMQNLPIFTGAQKIVYCDEILYFYRQAQESVTHNYSPTYYESYKIIMHELQGYISVWKLEEDAFLADLDVRIVQALQAVFANVFHAEKAVCKKKIQQICNDVWFRELYRRVDKKRLGWKTRIFFALAYARCIPLMLFLLKLV